MRAAGQHDVVSKQDSVGGMDFPLAGRGLPGWGSGRCAGDAAHHGQLNGPGGVADIHVVAGGIVAQVPEDLVAFPEGIGVCCVAALQ